MAACYVETGRLHDGMMWASIKRADEVLGSLELW